MAYQVVEFENNKEVAIVLADWVTPLKNEVFWPPYKDPNKIKKLLKNKSSLNEETWTAFLIKRVFCETDSYEEALRKQNKALVFSGLESEEDEGNHGKRKKQIPAKLYSQSSSDSENSDIQVSKYVRPPPVKSIPLKSKIKSVEVMKTLVPSIIEESQQEQTKQSQEQVAEVEKPPSNNKYCNCNCNEAAAHSEALNQILLQHLVTVKEQNKQILAKLENLALANSRTEEKLNWPVKLPISSTEDLLIFEEYLNADKIKAAAVQFSRVGGNGVTSITGRVLKELLEDTVAKDFNFFGHGAKKAFNDLETKKIIIGAVQFQGSYSNQSVEDAIKKWLKYAPARLAKGKKI